MRYLNYKLVILMGALAGAALALAPAPVYAQSLTVTFEATPLFSEANFLPGDSVTRSVTVQNSTGAGQVIGVKVDPYDDPDNLGSQLTVVIEEGATVLYGPATLDALNAASPVELSTVGDGQTTQYDFTVTFPASAGDEYQLAAVRFDLQVGILGEDVCTENCGETVIITLTDGGGGGGGGPRADLSLTKIIVGDLPTPGATFSYELTVTNQGPDSATNVTVTDVLPPSLAYVSSSASQGSYSELTGQWLVGGLANGASATLTITVSLSAAADQTVVNTASAVSSENDTDPADNAAQYTIVLTGGAPSGGPTPAVLGAQTGNGGTGGSGNTGGSGGLGGAVEGIATGILPALAQEGDGGSTGVLPGPSADCTVNLWWLLLLEAVAVLVAWYRERKSREPWRSRFWLVSLVLALVPLVLWWGACWLIWWLTAIIILTVIFLALVQPERWSAPPAASPPVPPVPGA